MTQIKGNDELANARMLTVEVKKKLLALYGLEEVHSGPCAGNTVPGTFVPTPGYRPKGGGYRPHLRGRIVKE